LLEVIMSPVFLAVLGVALVGLLSLMWRHGSYEEIDRAGDIPEGSEYVVRLPKSSLFHRCLSAEDLEFVRLRKSPALLRLFLHERRRLAMAWLRETKREARRLVRLHVRSVRFAADLRPAAEARLFLAVALFSLVYAALLAAVWWYGLLRTRRSLQSIRALAGILARLAERIVAGGIVPDALAGMGATAGVAR
jgi:hypothetical protein